MDGPDREQFEASVRLLEATHEFPCEFQFKVIGWARDQFVERVVLAIQQVQQIEDAPLYRVRETPSGRHVAVTLESRVVSPQEVLAIYREIQQIEGVVIVM